MDEIFESERLERELNDPASMDPRVRIARRVARMAASGEAAPTSLLVDAREQANVVRGAFGHAARRTALVAAAITMLGGATVAVAAHDAEPGSFLHPVRQAGHAVVSLFTSDDDTTEDTTLPEDDTDTDTDTDEPSTQPTDGPDDDRGRGNDRHGESADDRDRGHGNDDRINENGNHGKGRGPDADESDDDRDRGRGNDDRSDDDGNRGRGSGDDGDDDQDDDADEDEDESDDSDASDGDSNGGRGSGHGGNGSDD